MKYKIGFVSLGCPKNLTDTETMLGLLKSECEIVTKPETADIIIVNTCGFIESAKKESINTIIEMGQYKNSGNLKKLIVTGCLAQRYSDEILNELTEVDAVVGTGSYFEIQDIIKKVMRDEKPVMLGDINAGVPENLPRQLSTPSYTAYLKIADGCDNRCTYCIIPKLRGKYRSRTIENIAAEAKDLADKGVSELILIAQDTTAYGLDLYKKQMLPELIRQLSDISGIKWIRLHYCYPEMVMDELIDEMARNSKVCRYIDIPFQHASDSVLKHMGRRSTGENNIKLIQKLRGAMPDIIIRSTFIVGFPGETQEDFNKLKEFIKNMRLDRLGVFTYSAEEDTPAAKMKDQIPEDIKNSRQKEIMEIQSRISKDKNKAKIGSILKVLCEEKMGGKYKGRTAGDSPQIDCQVIFTGKDINAGQYIDVKITKASEYDLEGEEIYEHSK